MIRTTEDLQAHMNSCVGFDLQHEWMSVKPIDIHSGMGFTYAIHDLVSDCYYIGAKLFWFKRLVKIQGKKKRTTKESDWATYYGSSKTLTKLVEEHGEENFDRYLIDVWSCKRSIANEEAKLLHSLNVLAELKENGDYLFYNKWVGKAFRSEAHTAEMNSKEGE